MRETSWTASSTSTSFDSQTLRSTCQPALRPNRAASKRLDRGVQRLCQFTGGLKAAKSPYRLVTGTTVACATSRMPRRVGLQLHAQQCVDHRRDRRCRVAPRQTLNSRRHGSHKLASLLDAGSGSRVGGKLGLAHIGLRESYAVTVSGLRSHHTQRRASRGSVNGGWRADCRRSSSSLRIGPPEIAGPLADNRCISLPSSRYRRTNA